MAQAKKIEALEEQLGTIGNDFSAFKETLTELERRLDERLSSMDDRFAAMESLLRSLADQRVVTTAGSST